MTATKHDKMLPLLRRKTGATAAELIRSIRGSDSHDVQNVFSTIRHTLYYRVEKNSEGRWTALPTKKTPTPAKTTPASTSTTKKAKAVKVIVKSKKKKPTTPTKNKPAVTVEPVA